MVDINERVTTAGPQRRSIAGPTRPTSGAPYRPHSISKSFKGASISSVYSDITQLDNATNLLQMITECDDIIEGNISISTKISGTSDILCCKYTENFEYLAAGFSDGQLKLYNVHNGEAIHCLEDTDARSSPITAIKHRPVHKSHPRSNCLICSHTDGYVRCWNYNFLQCVYKIHEKRQTLGLTYHPRLPKFITFGDDGKLFLYDEETKMQERVFVHSDKPDVMDGHSSRIFSAVFHPLSMYEFISGGWDDTVQFWDIRQPTSIRHISGPHICGDSLDISKNGKQILTCSYQKTDSLQVWDFRTGSLLASLEPDIYPSMLYSGKFLTKDLIVCGGSDQNIFRIVDNRSHLTISNVRGLTGAVYCIDGGPIRKSKRGGKVIPDSTNPRIAFCAGKKLYQIEF